MKILYVGTLAPFGTCFSRFTSLRELEADVNGFDTDRFLDWGKVGRLARAFETYTLRGSRVRRANAELLAECERLDPDLVWIDSGDWVWPSTVRALKARGCFMVHHYTDALAARRRSVQFKRRLLHETAPLYDVFFTTNVDDQARMPAALLTDLGYDHRRFHPEPLSAEHAKAWDNPLVFIGHYEPETEAGILALIDAGLPVTVYGHEPWFKSKHRAKLGDHLQASLGVEDYERALKGSRIGLCFVSVLNYNQTASRSFEIPGSGTFLLAIRTDQHLECYEEGKEAEFFTGHEELVRKVKYYLEHEDERVAIAARGHARCVESGYSWDAIMARDWPKVRERFESRNPSNGAGVDTK